MVVLFQEIFGYKCNMFVTELLENTARHMSESFFPVHSHIFLKQSRIMCYALLLLKPYFIHLKYKTHFLY